MAIHEGVKVSYIGGEGHRGSDGLALGDQGKVIAEGGTGSHVLWSTGQRTGEITLTYDVDLSPKTSRINEFDDDLNDPSLVHLAVRDTYDTYGAPGLINALNDEGHLGMFEAIAEDTMGMISAKIRNDPSIQRVLAELDDEEVEDFVAQATAVLIRDAFGGSEEVI